jgi:hypothetical protein
MDLGLEARVGSRTSFEIAAGYEQRVLDAQWVSNAGSTLTDTAHFTFARLAQNQLDITARANVTLSPTLSVQVYAQPFIASGDFADWRELANPRAKEYAARYKPYGGGADPGGFNSKQFNSNVVMRWEYQPGSVFFVVWQQGRFDNRDPGTFEPSRDLRNLFGTHPDNTILVKLSYWFNP